MSNTAEAFGDAVVDRRGAYGLRLALIQWNGRIGGSEALTASLCAALRRVGADAQILFISDSEPLAGQLDHEKVPFRSLQLARGRDVLLRPRRFAEAVDSIGPDGALLPECGYVGAALRVGGYRAPVIAAEHGTMIRHRPLGPRRLIRPVSRLAAAWADDVEVAVSDFVLDHMQRRPHARRTVRIHNGVDPAIYTQAAQHSRSRKLVIGFAGRLRPGKGVAGLIAAFAQIKARLPATLLLAGDGPERDHLVRSARRSSVDQDVEFLGWVPNMPAFWHRCDVAVFPTDRLPETFGMAALEAMACGKPVVASRIGALPEVVADSTTGQLVAPGDTFALARAIISYGLNDALRITHGAAARRRAVDRFNIDKCARAYHDLFLELSGLPASM